MIDNETLPRVINSMGINRVYSMKRRVKEKD